MRVILHIGTFKTGSTMLQFAMGRDREYLYKNGYLYDDYFDKMYLHSNLAYGLLKEALEHYGLFEHYSEHPRFKNVAEDPQIVIERMKKHADGRDIIISSEALFADSYRTLIGLDASDERMAFMDKINHYIRRRLFDLLKEITDSIDVICYLRRQDLYIESQYKQVLRTPWYTGAKPNDFESFVKLNPIHLDYYTELSDWAEVFGKKAIRIKVYDSKLIRKGLVNDFYNDILGIPISNNTIKNDNERINESLHPVALEYLRNIEIRDERVLQCLGNLDFEKMGISKKMGYFSKQGRIDFLNKYLESNIKTAKDFMGGDGNLFDAPVDDCPIMNGLSDEEFRLITRQVIKSLV